MKFSHLLANSNEIFLAQKKLLYTEELQKNKPSFTTNDQKLHTLEDDPE